MYRNQNDLAIGDIALYINLKSLKSHVNYLMSVDSESNTLNLKSIDWKSIIPMVVHYFATSLS